MESYAADSYIVPEEPANIAGNLLNAIQVGNCALLESALERAERLARQMPENSSVSVEQAELLDAITGEIRGSLSRYQRRLSPCLEGAEVHISLLRHLAQKTLAQKTLAQ